MTTSPRPRIAIAGAGAIGLFVGGLLAGKGAMVSALARRARIAHLCQGVQLLDYEGLHLSVPADALGLTEDPAIAFAGADVVLVTVKSRDTLAMARRIRERAPRSATVVSLQNGRHNAAILRHQLPGFDVRAGVVAFNVAWLDAASLKRATSGPVVIEGGPIPALAALEPPLRLLWPGEIAPAQHAKLLLNLNNALNALSGDTLTGQFANPVWRRVMRRQLREAMAVMDAAGLPIGRVGSADPRALATALALPGPLFRLALRGRLQIDPDARSSMQDDLRAGRPTEIDELQGDIARLGRELGIATPLTDRVIDAIRAAEGAAQVPEPDPRALLD